MCVFPYGSSRSSFMSVCPRHVRDSFHKPFIQPTVLIATRVLPPTKCETSGSHGRQAWRWQPSDRLEVDWYFKSAYCLHHQGDDSTSETSVSPNDTTRRYIYTDKVDWCVSTLLPYVTFAHYIFIYQIEEYLWPYEHVTYNLLCNRYHGNAVKGFSTLWDNVYDCMRVMLKLL
jgi:hypothetical protein